MIMRLMRWLAAAALVAFILVFTLISCGPDLNGLHLSTCMGECNVVVKKCLESSNVHLGSCSSFDKECTQLAISETELCLTTCLDCISVCAADVEKQLKK